MSRWAMVVDVDRCINCANCVLATKDEYVGNAFPGYSAVQPPEGVETIKLERYVRGEGSSVSVYHVLRACNHCDNPPCVAAARDGAIYKRPDGIVMIDPVKSRGRRELVQACPYGMIEWNEASQVPQAWNFDAHLLDAGWAEPRCSQACPTGALSVLKMDDEALDQYVEEQRLQVMRPELNTKPRVFYRNLDKAIGHMVAGNIAEVVEGQGQRNVPGVAVVLRDSGEREERMVLSDDFGDFKFLGLAGETADIELVVRGHGGDQVIAGMHRIGSVDLGTLCLRNEPGRGPVVQMPQAI